MKTYHFDYFRYQLVPKKTIQTTIDGVASTYEDIKAKKNDYFAEVLKAVRFKNSKGDLPYKLIHDEEKLFYIWLSNIRQKRYIQDFKETIVMTNPFVDILIDNTPTNQVIAISKNIDAFEDSKAVVKILIQTLNRYLDKYNITLHIQAIFQKDEFWHIINARKSIKKITFEIIKPNISNISDVFRGELRELVEDTNSHQTLIVLNAPDNGALNCINQQNARIDSIVDYSAEGGGNIKVKFLNEKKTYQTEQSIKKEVITTQLIIEHATTSELNNFIQSVIEKVL
jgi:hypothetical protein